MQRRNFLHWMLAASLVGGCDLFSDKRLTPLAPGTNVLAFGNSITYGVGADRGQDYPSLLSRRTRWAVINGGVSGDTTETARPRIDGLIDQYQPELILLELGGNDFLRRRPAKAVKENLRQIVMDFRRRNVNVPIALIAIPDISLLGVMAQRLSDSPIYADLAKEERLWLIKDVVSDTLSDASLRADRVHPNAAGYEKLTDGIQAALKKIGALP